MLRWSGSVYFLLLVIGISDTLGSPTSSVPKVDTQLVQNVYLALEKMLNFFGQDYSSINLDGLFGLRLGQGQLISTLEECQKRSCDRNLSIGLKTLLSKVEDICFNALPYVEQYDPTYYKSLLPKCNFTADCMAYMTQNETARYFITHQLLYFIILENVGCADIVQLQTGSRRILEIETNLCQRIYDEAESYIENSDVDGVKRDLFLEQVNLCGILGFENFMKTDWIRMILGWLDWRDGCFKINQKSVGEMVDADINSQQNDQGYSMETRDMKRIKHKRDVEYEKENQATFGRNKGSMRKLLRDKKMRDGCRSHTSGLGFGGFGVFLRYLYRNV
ncbi:hypothetical protein CHS0354_000124 [Potamilus streckersoni]|uniref:Uncharacterized protein n=1 Tax=Potamilus streckersoni TaxID=2493646 RepID=A0AAE0RY40_9BIVA|nr:hypothetical protein CHS0354_000124 [Potamilus streckersoni]